MLQRELGILSFAASGWASVVLQYLICDSTTKIFYSWSCLGIKLADIARSNKDPTASLANIIAGQYIEAAVSSLVDCRQPHLGFTCGNLAHRHIGCIYLHWNLLFLVY